MKAEYPFYQSSGESAVERGTFTVASVALAQPELMAEIVQRTDCEPPDSDEIVRPNKDEAEAIVGLLYGRKPASEEEQKLRFDIMMAPHRERWQEIDSHDRTLGLYALYRVWYQAHRDEKASR